MFGEMFGIVCLTRSSENKLDLSMIKDISTLEKTGLNAGVGLKQKVSKLYKPLQTW